jgi:hypothetical protein
MVRPPHPRGDGDTASPERDGRLLVTPTVDDLVPADPSANLHRYPWRWT